MKKEETVPTDFFWCFLFVWVIHVVDGLLYYILTHHRHYHHHHHHHTLFFLLLSLNRSILT